MYCINFFLKELSLLQLYDFGKNETLVVQEMLSFKKVFTKLPLKFIWQFYTKYSSHIVEKPSIQALYIYLLLKVKKVLPGKIQITKSKLID